MRTFIYADKFFLKTTTKDKCFLEISNGRFGEFYITIPETHVKILNFSGKWIAPGLVDTHIHGYKGHDVMDATFESLQAISNDLLSCGVTSFLPTTLTASKESLMHVSEVIKNTRKEVGGAKIQGIYFEGPFFSEKYKGAQNPNYLIDPDIETFNQWQTASGGLIKKIALAPERVGAKEFIDEVTQQGVVVALGHSNATLEQANVALDVGATVFVHAYNAMSGLNHREPGMVGSLLSSKETYAELICDGHHVHTFAAKILKRSIGWQRIALITDCMRAGGMPEGEYHLGELPVTVKNGTARLKEGNLAGSILKLKEALKNVVKWGLATPEEAIHMATYVPAASCKIDDVCGVIRPGRPADFIVLSKNMDLQATFLNGINRYSKFEGEFI